MNIRFIRYGIVFIRLYLGGWMLLNGLNHFVEIFPQPMGGPDKSSQLMVSLIETGLFGLVKSTEILVGIMLLLDLFVPVALVLAMPISVVVWYNHAILSGKPFDFSMGIGCLIWNSVLLVAYLPYFLPMVRFRAETGTLANLTRIREIFVRKTDTAPESQHRVAIVFAGAIITAYLFYQLHPHTEQSPGAGKTPVTIVKDYLDLTYRQGKPSEAKKMYVSPDLTAGDDTLAPANDGQAHTDKILKIIGQGSNVAVYHRISGLSGSSDLDVVDLYKIAKNRIVEHSRVAESAIR